MHGLFFFFSLSKCGKSFARSVRWAIYLEKKYGRQSQMLRKSQNTANDFSHGTRTIGTVEVNRTISFRCCSPSKFIFFFFLSFSSCSNCSKNDAQISSPTRKKKKSFSNETFFGFTMWNQLKKKKKTKCKVRIVSKRNKFYAKFTQTENEKQRPCKRKVQ